VKHFPLVWAGLWRRPARTTFTFISIVIAFVLFGIMMGLNSAFDAAFARARMDRIFVGARFGMVLPMGYVEQLAQMPGVKAVSPQGEWFGYHQDPKNFMFVMAVDDSYPKTFPESTATTEQFAAMRKIRNGALVTERLAARMAWKAGQRVTIQTPDPPMHRSDGTQVWDFDIIAIIPDDSDNLMGAMFGNLEYLDEARLRNKGFATFVQLLVDDPARADEIALAIDRRFANSAVPTRSGVERIRLMSAVQGTVDIKFMAFTVVGAALFMLLFLTGNVMAQSVRERWSEFAVLKTLGYSNRAVSALLVAEATIPCVGGAIIGSLAAAWVARAAAALLPAGPNAPLPHVSWSIALYALVAACAVAVLSALPAARRLSRQPLVDALAGR
jgi:putative ABC transport system permease protein